MMTARDRETAMKPFERIIEEHGPVVLRVCRAVLGSNDAEDAWSETFMAALKAYPRLRAGSNVRGWLVTIAHRKAIDIARTRTRGPIAVGQLPEIAAAAHQRPARWADLAAALESLPPRQREAVAYHYIAGLSYKDVAAITGSNASASRRAAADGIAALRRVFQTRKVKGATR